MIDPTTKYEYRDAAGNVVLTKYKTRPPAKCPKCGSGNLRDKGSFQKCMDCGERLDSSLTSYA